MNGPGKLATWEAVRCISPGMDEASIKRLLSDAEDDDNPEFRISADSRSAKPLVQAIRASMEILRALRDPNARRVEIDVRDGRLKGICVDLVEDPRMAGSLDDVARMDEFQTTSVDTFRGQVTSMRRRVHRKV